MKLDQRLLRLALRQAAFFLTIGGGFVGCLLTIGQARLLTEIIDAVFLRDQSLAEVQGLIEIVLLVILVRAGLSWLVEVSGQRTAAQIKQILRWRLIKHLFALGPLARGRMLETDDSGAGAQSGEATNLLTEGVEALDSYFSQYLPQVFLALANPLAILLFVIPIDPLSGLVFLLTGPLIPLFMALIGSQANLQTKKQWQALHRLSSCFLDAIQGLATLKLLGRSREYAAVLDQASEEHRQMTLGVLRISFLSALTLELLSTLSTAVVAVQIGVRLLYSDHALPGGALQFTPAFFVLLLAPEFYLPLRLLGLRFHAGMSGAAAGERIFEILDSPLPHAQPPAASGLHQTEDASQAGQGAALKVEKVSFTYPNGVKALDEVSFTLPAGKITALVGVSGAGKSTLAAILLGFLLPDTGRVTFFDGPPAAGAPRIAWSPQHPYLFAASAAENIRLARPEASDAEVAAAARLAHADEFIGRLPQGYGAPLGERGVRLSGGQAQRIALARAFLSNAPILILDEPTSHLDPLSESFIHDSLQDLAETRTVLIIAHRPQTISRAHQVIRLEQGRVVEARQVVPEMREGDAKRKRDEKQEMRNEEPAGEDEKQGRWDEYLDLQETARPPAPLTSFLRPFLPHIALSVLLGCGTVLSGVGLMVTAAYIIASAALHPSVAELQVAIVGVRVFGLARGFLRYLERLVSHDVTFRVLARLRGWFYRALEPLAPLNDLHSGDLLARAISDIASLENFYVRAVAPPLTALLVALGAALFLGAFAAPLAWLLLAFLFSGGVIVPLLMASLSRRAGRAWVAARAHLNVAVVDALQGMADLLAFRAAERYQFRHIERAAGQAINAQWTLAVLNGLQSALAVVLANGSMAAVLLFVIPLVNGGLIPGVMLPVLALAALTSFEAVQPLPQAAQYLEANRQSVRRLNQIAQRPALLPEPANPRPAPAQFHFEVRHLSFAYTPGRLALDDICLNLPPGRRVALVGTSGCGKTTLFNLLWRTLRSEAGEGDALPVGAPILLNGISVEAYSPDALRRDLAILPQNPYLFRTTVRENLLLARPEASQAQIEQAARLAGIHDLIASLPQGYETWVGEHGLRLSGGEKQRIALARAFLKDAPLLILDEPTAHLDPATEKVVIANLRSFVAGEGAPEPRRRSLLLATHRLVDMDWFDEILVLESGRIVGQGTHAELLQHNTLYRQLVGVNLGREYNQC